MNYPKPASVMSGRSAFPRTACLLAFLMTVAAAFAQTAEPSATPAPSTNQDDVVKLSPFTVSSEQDQGYRASNSIAGTRSNTPIKDIPLNIQVFTKALADDLHITNQVDLERYNAALVNGGADVRSDNPIQQAYNGFLFRGFVQNWGLRDGIREYDPIDMIGVSRVELVKGPAAPLYGLTYPGGVMNVITKDVDFKQNFADVGLTLSSYGERRATLDANMSGKLGSGVMGIRYSGAYAETHDDRRHSGGRVRFNQIVMNWHPLQNTEIKLLADDGYRSKPNGLGYFSKGETDSQGNALGNGTDIPLQIFHPNIPWTWNWATGNNRTIATHLYRATLTQSVGDNLVITAYAQNSTRLNVDSNGWDAAGGGGSAASWDMGYSSQGGFASGWMTLPNGQEVIRMGYHYRDWQNSMSSYGATALYKMNFDVIKNTFTFGGAAWKEIFHTHKWISPGNTTNLWDIPVQADVNLAVPANPPADYFPDLSQWSHENNSNDYYFASWQGAMFNGKLHLNASINRTNLKLVQWADGYSTTMGTTTQESKTSPMFGAIYAITKGLSVFAVHSTSLFPTTDKNSFGKQMPPVVGTSNEGGVKIELLNGKISGTISYYEITQEGGSQTDSSANNLNTQLWDSLTPAQRAAQFPGKTRNDLLGDLVPGGKQQSKGVEADLVFQPTPEWQIMLSYANNNEEVKTSSNPATIGQATAGHIKQQWSLLTKYSFDNGSLKGLYLGAGLQAAGRALQDYNIPGGRYNPSTFYAETFAGYRFKAGGFNQYLQLNIKNLTRQDEYVGWQATGSSSVYATQRYRVSTPVTWSLSYGIDF